MAQSLTRRQFTKTAVAIAVTGPLVGAAESSALEAGFSHKWYVSGIGMVGDDELRLMKYETPK